MKIQRKRYAVVRNNKTEIWGGCAKNFYFKPITDVGDFAIKTYRTENQAKASCYYWRDDFEVVPVLETIESVVE